MLRRRLVLDLSIGFGKLKLSSSQGLSPNFLDLSSTTSGELFG